MNSFIMNSFILINADQFTLDTLAEAGIDYYNWDENSIIVTESQERLSQALGFKGLNAAASEWDGFYLVDLNEQICCTPTAMPATDSMQGKYANTQLGQARENYIKLARTRMDQWLAQTLQAFEKTNAKLLSLAGAFFKRAQLAQAKTIKTAGADGSKLLAEQYRALMAIDKVKSVRFSAGRILIFTDVLTATAPNVKGTRELGRFLITVDTTGTLDTPISCHNLTRRIKAWRSGMHAPQVFADGKLCPAEILESIFQLTAEQDLPTAIELLLQHLQVCQNDAIGEQLKAWPLVH
ncbi:MAG TPA: hypothetical protein PL112_06700 [Candidatus Obscuribacter sp.]|nr:hypothetical protein [Candidatus Obscuribacter sp.]